MKKLRVLMLVDEDFVPPPTIEGLTDKQIAPWKTEYDVMVTLEELEHEVTVLGLSGELDVVGKAIEKHKPHIVFNMLEEFRGKSVFVPYLLGYLELIHQPYTGCNPAGMILAHGKALSKTILRHHRIRVPDFHVFAQGRKVRKPAHLSFPLFVKSATEHGSVGISQRSIVRDDDQLKTRVEYIFDELETDAIAEQYIDGREFYVGVMGNRRVETFPPWELLITKRAGNVPVIATEKLKWDFTYQKKTGVKTQAAQNLPDGVTREMGKICKRAYRALGQTGYARLDLRLSTEGKVYVLESNSNPQLQYGEDFAESAHSVGVDYNTLLQRILDLGLRGDAAWRS